MSGVDFNSIVIDNGTFSIKAGFSGDEVPRSVFRTVVGRPKDKSHSYGSKQKDIFIGDEVINQSLYMTISNPLERGVIKNWDDMEIIWNYAFNKLRVSPSGCPVLLTEKTIKSEINPRKNNTNYV